MQCVNKIKYGKELNYLTERLETTEYLKDYYEVKGNHYYNRYEEETTKIK